MNTLAAPPVTTTPSSASSLPFGAQRLPAEAGAEHVDLVPLDPDPTIVVDHWR